MAIREQLRGGLARLFGYAGWPFLRAVTMLLGYIVTHPGPRGLAEGSAVMAEAKAQATPGLEHEVEPALEHEVEPSLEHESTPELEHESQTELEHESETRLEHESQPRLEHESGS